MTAYSFSGLLVDVKAYNWHMSAPLNAVPGATHTTAGTATIDAGAIVMDDGAGGLQNALDASGALALGVMNETRAYSASDNRQATYTWAGVVRVITSEAVTLGNHIRAEDAGKVQPVDDTLIAEHVLAFGKALETAGAGDVIIMAYVNFAH